MKLVTVLSASTLLALAGLACGDTTTVVQPAPGSSSSGGATSSSGGENTSGGLQGEGEASASSAPNTNAAGDPYPTSGLGTKEGAIIRNYKFLGYPDADTSELKPISLAQYFDPTGETYQLIHIQAAGVWCSACRGETKALVPLAQELKAKKVIWIVSIAEGATPGTASKTPDLADWIGEFESPFTHVLDPGNKNLGPFYDRSALPWNANIDATTMKVLTSGTGGAQTGDAILAEIDEALAMVGGK